MRKEDFSYADIYHVEAAASKNGATNTRYVICDCMGGVVMDNNGIGYPYKSVAEYVLRQYSDQNSISEEAFAIWIEYSRSKEGDKENECHRTNSPAAQPRLVHVKLYCYGTCPEKNAPGGWGAILQYGKHEKTLCGSSERTTTNRMSMQAVIHGLQSLNRECDVQVFSDSSFLVKIMQSSSLYRWAENGWKKSNGDYVANRDLWRILLELCRIHYVDFCLLRDCTQNDKLRAVKEIANSALSTETDDRCVLFQPVSERK